MTDIVKTKCASIMHKKTSIIQLKKMKKDGSIDAVNFKKIRNALKEEQILIMPVDCIYGYTSILHKKIVHTLEELSGEKEGEIIRLISSFKMLEDIALIDKLEYDFLHRIWPGELTVKLKDHGNMKRSIPLRMPKSKFVLDLIDNVDEPVFFSPLKDSNGSLVYRKKSLMSHFSGKADLMLVVDEFCKEHAIPTYVDVSNGELKILLEGRISAEEVKSLYFLGKDDPVV